MHVIWTLYDVTVCVICICIHLCDYDDGGKWNIMYKTCVPWWFAGILDMSDNTLQLSVVIITNVFLL